MKSEDRQAVRIRLEGRLETIEAGTLRYRLLCLELRRVNGSLLERLGALAGPALEMEPALSGDEEFLSTWIAKAAAPDARVVRRELTRLQRQRSQLVNALRGLLVGYGAITSFPTPALCFARVLELLNSEAEGLAKPGLMPSLDRIASERELFPANVDESSED